MARSQKRKDCPFCRRKLVDIDYKDPAAFTRYITPWAKIKPTKDTGACAKHQRRLAEAIKRARFMALLAFTTR